MNKLNNIDAYGIKELSATELMEINGGDKFTHDFGWTIGWIGRAIQDGLEALSENISEIPVTVTNFG